MPRALGAGDVLNALPHGARVLVQGGAGESRLVAQAIEAGVASRPDLSFVGVMLPGVNTHTYGGAFTTFFMSPEMRAAGAAFLPIGYNDIRAHLADAHLDAVIFTASPPDAEGLCSFGVAVDFAAELWPRIPLRIAQLNPGMPRTHGHPGIPYEALSVAVAAEAPLLEAAAGGDDAVTRAIAGHVATLAPDGATLQAGIGKAPGACMRGLVGKRALRIHSGFVGDWVLDLLDAGAIARDAPITTGLALGGPRLYAAVGSPAFEFRPVAHTHNPEVLRGQDKLVTINAALEVDLLGQVYAERTASGFISGPGGALDFARGAKLAGGLRVIVTPSQARGASRIVAPGAGAGPVSLSRFDVDVVVTEFGAADVRGCGHDARAERLIAIAAPAHRKDLAAAWRRYQG